MNNGVVLCDKCQRCAKDVMVEVVTSFEENGCKEMSVEKNVEGRIVKYNGCEGRRWKVKVMTTKLVKAAKRRHAINNASSNRPPETERTLHATNIFSRRTSRRENVACVARWTTVRAEPWRDNRQRAGSE